MVTLLTTAAPDAVLRAGLDALVTTAATAAVARVTDGVTGHGAAAGTADLATGRPAAPEHLFRAGSLTKAFVAVAVLRLVDAGRVELDAPAGSYLPELLRDHPRVTVRQLLNHTGGLVDTTEVRPVTPADLLTAARFRTTAPSRLAEAALARPAHFEPGAEWRYSNTGYLVLALLLERVTGERYETLLGRILAAAGLGASVLPGTSPFIPGPHLRGYAWPGRGGARRPIDITVQNPAKAWGSGDLITTAADLCRFFTALFTAGLLSRRALRELTTTVPADEGRDWGLALFRGVLPDGRPAWGCTGGFGGYLTVVRCVEDPFRCVSVSVTPKSETALPDVRAFADRVLAGFPR
ncbi:beta-lactamase family protein [Amycolatopsis sp. NBC_00348]|uniref:serine hydrolase domain-containing protein n=1 Tax=Amycolatopsis sp. NBC_00348 TaxID=2975956 RepID=UPI002E258A69